MEPQRRVPALKSLYVADDALVLANRPLRPGSRSPRFVDDVWDLSVAILAGNRRHRCLLDFSHIEDPIRRLTMKELAFALLNRPPKPRKGRMRRKRRNVRTVQAKIWNVGRWLEWCDGRYQVGACIRLAQVTQAALNEWLKEVRAVRVGGRELNPTYLSDRVNALAAAYEYRDFLSFDALSFEPWGGTFREQANVQKSEENSTERIPEAVMAPYLHGALYFVQNWADEILGAVEARGKSARRSAPRTRGAAGKELILGYVDQLRASNRGVPRHPIGSPVDVRNVSRGQISVWDAINRSAISVELGLQPSWVNQQRRTIEHLLLGAVRELGWDQKAGKVVGHAPKLCDLIGGLVGVTLNHAIDDLVAACYVVIGYLSGMRDSEIQSIRTGSVHRATSSDGLITRYHVASRVFKGCDGDGSEATWVVIKVVVEAIEVLERLYRLLVRTDELLFGNRMGGSLEITKVLNFFRDRINQLAECSDVIFPIPKVDGCPWGFNSLQLRRTMAWYIANRPFGIVAGKIQYKHASTAMFEGYAGTSESGFRDEVARERELGAGDDLLERFRSFATGERSAGGAGTKLDGLFSAILDAIGGVFPSTIAGEAEVRSLLAHTEILLISGLFIDCIFVEEDALCLKLGIGRKGPTPGELRLPVMAFCNPFNCRNARIGQRHLAMWVDHKDQIGKHLNRPRLPVLQRRSLLQELGRVSAVISSVESLNP